MSERRIVRVTQPTAVTKSLEADELDVRVRVASLHAGTTYASRLDLQEVVGFFDLANSTQYKLEHGADEGAKRAIKFVLVAASIVVEHGGRVLKNLGDGVLVTFDDPVAALQAACDVRDACAQSGLDAALGLTSGLVSEIELMGSKDVYGATVDRAARVASLAGRNAIAIDRALYDQVSTYLADRGLRAGQSFIRQAKGTGDLELRHVVPSNERPGLPTYFPFEVIGDGRAELRQKIAFSQYASSEVVWVGIGLTTLAGYFKHNNPHEYISNVISLLKSGVNVSYYLLDPGYKPGRVYVRTRLDAGYARDMKSAISTLRVEAASLNKMGMQGRASVHLYRLMPEFHALAVDLADPASSRIMMSPYLHGVPHQQSPVYLLSRQANTTLFDTYRRAVDEVLLHSEQVT